MIVLQHWNSHERPHTSKFDSRDWARIALFSVILFCRKIGNVGRRLGCHHATDNPFRVETKRRTPRAIRQGPVVYYATPGGIKLRRPTDRCCQIGIADTVSILQHGRKYRLQIAQ